MRALGTASLLMIVLSWNATAALTPGPVVTKYSGGFLADIDSDGLTDVVHSKYVLLNQGGGSFVKRDFGLLGMVNAPGLWNGGDDVIATLDLNGDGRLDLLTRDSPTAPHGMDAAEQQFRVYIAGEQLNYGKGFEIRKGPRALVAPDLDGDGKDDLVLVSHVFEGGTRIATELTPHISLGDGTFSSRSPIRVPENPQFFGIHSLQSKDLNHDGFSDLVIRAPKELVVLRGIGGGEFAPPDIRYLPRSYVAAETLELGDIDGDGNLDVAMSAYRMVRVFLGDGTGRFPRVVSAATRRLRNIPGMGPDVDGKTNPRSLALGQFIRKGRTEIAAGTAEGDVLVFAYESGMLREVSRTETEFPDAYVNAGVFRESGETDMFLTGNYGYNYGAKPPSRLFYVDPAPPVLNAAHSGGRTRAVRGFASPMMKFDVEMRGNCAPEATVRWTIAREGVFGLERRSAAGESVSGLERAEETVETLLDGGPLMFRLTVPWASEPLHGELARTQTGYRGEVFTKTQCGSGYVQFTVTQR